jgi:hypothetical protein
VRDGVKHSPLQIYALCNNKGRDKFVCCVPYRYRYRLRIERITIGGWWLVTLFSACTLLLHEKSQVRCTKGQHLDPKHSLLRRKVPVSYCTVDGH